MKRSKRAWIAFLGTRIIGALADLSIIAAAYFSAFALRFDFAEPSWGYRKVALCLVSVSAVYMAALLVTGCYRLAWRRITVVDIPRYLAATFSAGVILTIMRFFTPVDTFSHIRPPYSITVISCILVTAGVIAVRWAWAVYCRSKVNVEALLSREVNVFDNSVAARFFSGKCVMVTGAGGSIGSEIVLQVSRAGAKRVLMVERGENALYEIRRKVVEDSPSCEFVALLKDILDKDAMRGIFEKFRPEIVLHAAAYKHVPMIEENPDEGWRNNLGGTEILAELSLEFGVRRFVLISTDKAVNPVSVMGKTKKAAEEAVMALNSKGTTSFCAVRFGNVLGSSGSVVPLFKELIAKRRALTVTHVDMQRYFMTVGEAVNLVLQAASRSEGALYTLDMGKPVRIIDLAEDMIRQAGFRPYVDIPIVFTGIRPGEKILEELDVSENKMYRTDMAKIYITKTVSLALAFFSATLLFADVTGKAEETLGATSGTNMISNAAFAPYQAVIDRQIFGEPPPGFNPELSPEAVSSSRRGSGALGEEEKEKQDLIKSVRFTTINLDQERVAHVGFTDTSDPKIPKHFYLKVGQERRGWKVISADAVAGTVVLEKDSIQIELSLGQASNASSLKKGDVDSANSRARSLRERRRLRELERAEAIQKERLARQSQAASAAAAAEDRAAIAQQLETIKDAISSMKLVEQTNKDAAANDSSQESPAASNGN